MTVEEIKALISEKTGLRSRSACWKRKKADAENSETFFEKEVARLQAESREKDELLGKAEAGSCGDMRGGKAGTQSSALTLTRCVHKRRWPPGPSTKLAEAGKGRGCAARRPGGRSGKSKKGC